MVRRLPQLELFPARTRKAKRGRRLGRKPRAGRVGFVPHQTRTFHDRNHPVHVTIRRVALAPSLRAERIYTAIFAQLVALKSRGVRVLHYSVQDDHIHLMVESEDRIALSRQMQLLFSRIALAVNRVAQRRGALFRDRHHRHELRTPTETRRALVYVIFNTRKHAQSYRLDDTRSSMAWFRAWDPMCSPPAPSAQAGAGARDGPDAADATGALGAPVVAASTWMAREGWLRAGGPLRFRELPRRG